MDGMPSTLFDARQASGNMEVEGSRARTAQESRLKEPKDSPKRRASNDVIMQFDLTVGDQPTETTDEDELVHAAGAATVKPPLPKAPHRRHSDSPNFGREPLGGKHHNKLAAPPRFAGEVAGPASNLAGKPAQVPTPLPKPSLVQVQAPNLLNSVQASEAPPSE